MLALALLLGAACSDSKGAGADAATDRPVDTNLDMGMADAAAERPADSGTAAGDTGAGDVRADSDEADGGDAAAARLCDGTLRARLIHLNAGGGPLWPTFSFSGAYGHAFFVIDGTCHYWVGESFLKGIHTGVLLPARADQIARDLHYTRFASLKGVTGLAGPDASTRTLSDGVNRIHCTGDCTLQSTSVPTPPEYQQAFQRLQRILDDLFAAGTPEPLPIRVIATDPDYDNGPAVAWPLSWSPSEVMVSLQSNPPPSAGRLITSGSELSALRQLRQSAVANNASAFGIKVRDADGKLFSVMPRDEAPPVVVEGLAAAATR